MVEPFAVGMHAATKAGIKPGATAVVLGAGPIGTMVALSALAAGAGQVIISDLAAEKLAIAGQYAGIRPFNIRNGSLVDYVAELTGGWGADVVFEASGSTRAYDKIFDLLAPAGTLILVGLPLEPVAFDVVAAQAKEARVGRRRRARREPRARSRRTAGFGKGGLEATSLGQFSFCTEHRRL